MPTSSKPATSPHQPENTNKATIPIRRAGTGCDEPAVPEFSSPSASSSDYVPWISNVAVAGDVSAARAKAERDNVPPREAWMMECVQEDPSNPQPCSGADRAKYAARPALSPETGGAAPSADDVSEALPDAGCNPDFDDCSDAGGGK